MDAWEYLKGQYKMTNARALDIALTKVLWRVGELLGLARLFLDLRNIGSQ